MISKKHLLSCVFFIALTSAVFSQNKQIKKDNLFGNRFLTWNAVIRVNQIEVARDRNEGFDERGLHTPERVKAYREAIAKGMPGGRITWALSWLALHDTSANYRAIHKLVAKYHRIYGDEVTFIPGGYFANAYNTRAQVNRDLHDALQAVSNIVGNGYRPKSIVAGFLSAENQQYLAEKEGIHVCQGNIWSQFSIDNQDGDGSISYPYYTSKEHFCKPAQSKEDFIDCVNLDGWTVDFLAARREGFNEGFNSRMGVGPIETIGKYGQQTGTKQMIHATAVHFDKGFELNRFAWVAQGWELSLEYDYDYITAYLKQVKARWPDVKMVTQGEFGLAWRAHYKENSFNYQFVERGSGIGGSDIDKEIRWFMNKDFRLALLKSIDEPTGFKVIDFTRYDLKATEPKDMTRKWSLMGEINQKQTRPQDKPVPLDSLSASSLSVIHKVYKDLPEIGHAQTIKLSANSKGRVFEGIGAVSAGASSRNLADYPEKQRSEILDFLFKPKFGASLQHLKVEIGSGENSTCGSEPSHAITLNELKNPVSRGYEFWLMAEARKRNPKVILDCLPWGYPSWVGSRFSQNSADWIVSFLELARKKYGLELDWIAAGQNEMGTDLNWVANVLRPTLDARGFSKVKLQAPDDDNDYWQIFDTLEKDTKLNKLVDAVGYHYVDGREPWDIDQVANRRATEKAKRSGKPLWASEEWSQSGERWDGQGTLYLARLMNKLYSIDRITKYEIWCPVDGIYDQIIWANTGALQSDSPWSGHYTVWPAVWALGHTTQFAEPGWVYMDDACGQLDPSTWKGSHVALRNPKTGDWSVIIVTGDKRKITLDIGAGLKNGPVHVWRSTDKAQFVELPAKKLTGGKIELALEANAIYSVTNTTGQQKGTYGTPPPAKAFPFPYEENFEAYQDHETPRFFSDQKGTFETYRYPNGTMCLAQAVPEEGILWYSNWLLKPHSLIGDKEWSDYAIEGDVLLKGGDVEIGGRYAERDSLGYRWILTRDGRWQLNWQYSVIASGQIKQFASADWHKLRLEMNGSNISGFVDGKKMISVQHDKGSKGMAFIASTYDRNLFDNIKLSPTAFPE